MGKYSSVLEVLISRIEAHQSGILSAFDFNPQPVKEIFGQKNFPTIRLQLPDLMEINHPSGIVDGTMTLKVAISTSIKQGVTGFASAAELVSDALETDPQTLAYDLSLGRTLVKPMVVVLQQPFATELSLNGLLLISALPRLTRRGNRRGA